MKPGGTFNTRVYQNDLNEIQSGQIYTPMLIALPLTLGFQLGTDNPSVDSAANAYGARPDLATGSGTNPIVNNTTPAAKGPVVPITPLRIQLNQPCNCIQLLWHALDGEGNYRCSYPLNSPLNANVKTWAATDSPATTPGTIHQHWAFGWIRVNGIGPWLPMSLLPSTDTYGGAMSAFPFGGFSSITGPMSFIDWIGYWDGAGVIVAGPQGTNAHILALASANMSLSSNRASIGQVQNYASPSGSGPQTDPQTVDTVRSQDVLTRTGNG